jgi:hypothetical protein
VWYASQLRQLDLQGFASKGQHVVPPEGVAHDLQGELPISCPFSVGVIRFHYYYNVQITPGWFAGAAAADRCSLAFLETYLSGVGCFHCLIAPVYLRVSVA